MVKRSELSLTSSLSLQLVDGWHCPCRAAADLTGVGSGRRDGPSALSRIAGRCYIVINVLCELLAVKHGDLQLDLCSNSVFDMLLLSFVY